MTRRLLKDSGPWSWPRTAEDRSRTCYNHHAFLADSDRRGTTVHTENGNLWPSLQLSCFAFGTKCSPDLGPLQFLSVPPDKKYQSSNSNQATTTSISIPVHYSLIILPFDTIQPEILTVSYIPPLQDLRMTPYC
jgi:hypothetical protein